jgi:hypothetical protein
MFDNRGFPASRWSALCDRLAVFPSVTLAMHEFLDDTLGRRTLLYPQYHKLLKSMFVSREND